MLLTIDSSVFLASLIEKEEHYSDCRKLLQKIVNSEHIVVVPYSVLIEIVASIKRRTGSEELAYRIGIDLQNIETIYFFELSKQRVIHALSIARKTGLRGMDAIVVQIAKENNSALITLDNEMAKAAKEIVEVLPIKKITQQ